MRPKRNDEVVETIAGIVCSDNNGSILPVIFSGMFKTTVLTSLDKKTTFQPITIRNEFYVILEITMSVINIFLGYKYITIIQMIGQIQIVCGTKLS